MFCAEWCLVKRTRPGLTIIPLRCRCWTCEECQPRRRSQLIREGVRGKPNLFITLTSVYRPGGSPAAAARALVCAWRKVREEYIKVHGKGSLPFLAVFEATLNGWPHLHIIARAKWVSQKWLSKRMAALTGAKIVWVERIKGGRRTVNYVTKYVGKEPMRFATVKRYWRSQDYLLPSDEQEGEEEELLEPWRIVQQNWIDYANSLANILVQPVFTRNSIVIIDGDLRCTS